jgi:HK97 gp10 family phage protein
MSAIASADITRIAEALRRTGRDADATTQRTLIEAANFLVVEMQVRVPVDSGKLRDSIGVRIEGTTIRVGPDVPYATYVEFGTRPHEIKPKKPGGVLAFKVNGQQVYARVVNHPGTPAQPFVRPAFDAWVATLGRDVAEANVKVLREEAGA